MRCGFLQAATQQCEVNQSPLLCPLYSSCTIGCVLLCCCGCSAHGQHHPGARDRCRQWHQHHCHHALLQVTRSCSCLVLVLPSSLACMCVVPVCACVCVCVYIYIYMPGG